MAAMFRNVALNLIDEGCFVGVTPHPTDDPKGYVERALALRPTKYTYLTVRVVREVDDGVATHLDADTEAGKSVFERATREGDLSGKLEWRAMRMPDEMYGGGDEE
ncbi:hypothetical protein MMC28_009734 [Mycoblastus sanguinarius]|nr:hypothetical protein [Mycoblastus sanguinarius]